MSIKCRFNKGKVVLHQFELGNRWIKVVTSNPTRVFMKRLTQTRDNSYFLHKIHQFLFLQKVVLYSIQLPLSLILSSKSCRPLRNKGFTIFPKGNLYHKLCLVTATTLSTRWGESQNNESFKQSPTSRVRPCLPHVDVRNTPRQELYKGAYSPPPHSHRRKLYGNDFLCRL